MLVLSDVTNQGCIGRTIFNTLKGIYHTLDVILQCINRNFLYSLLEGINFLRMNEICVNISVYNICSTRNLFSGLYIDNDLIFQIRHVSFQFFVGVGQPRKMFVNSALEQL